MLSLTSLWLLFAIGAAAVLTLAIGIRALRRSGAHRLLVTSTSGLLCLVFLLTGVAAGVNRHFRLYNSWRDLVGLHSPDLVAAQNPRALAKALASRPDSSPPRTHGQLLSLTIPSPVSHLHTDGALVYLPPQYGTAAYATQGFPVVEAIPGSPGKPRDYIFGLKADLQLDRAIATHKIPPTIVVFPPSNRSIFRSLECADTADGYRDETFLTTDVHNWVTNTLHTNGARWTVMGYSTGGYCALDLSLRRPDLFSRAISLDGYTHALRDHYARGIWPNGPAGEQARLEHSPDWWMQHHPAEPVDLYLSAGSDDEFAASAAVSLWQQLSPTGWKRPYDRLLVAKNGHHTFPVWSKAFVPALEWALADTPGVTSPSSSVALTELERDLARRCALPTPSPTPTPSPNPTASSHPFATPTTSAVPTCRKRRHHTTPGYGETSPTSRPSPQSTQEATPRSSTTPQPTPRPTSTSSRKPLPIARPTPTVRPTRSP